MVKDEVTWTKSADLKILAPFALALILLNVLSFQLPFFWDAIYQSKLAHWYLEHNFSSFLVPPEMDAGHPPFLPLLIAAVWKIFGRSLLISHLIMLPFLMAIPVQLYLLFSRLSAEKKFIPAAMAAALAGPAFLAQATMPAPDIILLTGFLLAINGILIRKSSILISGILLMLAVSLRGIPLTAAVFLAGILIHGFSSIRKDLKFWLLSAGIPFLLFLGWLVIHHQHTGWWLSVHNEAYGSQREMLGPAGMIRNLAILVWRVTDHGRIFLLFAVTLFAGINLLRLKTEGPFKNWLIIWLTTIGILIMAFIPFSNPIGHRYFLPFYFISAGGLLFLLPVINRMQRFALMVLVIGGMLGGHFWVYPDGIAKGWDASLAHVPYFHLRAEMIGFARKNEIPFDETGTGFPNYYTLKITDLQADTLHFRNFTDRSSMNDWPYIVQSNVFNGFEAEMIGELETKWVKIKELRSWPVYMILYQNPAYQP